MNPDELICPDCKDITGLYPNLAIHAFVCPKCSGTFSSELIYSAQQYVSYHQQLVGGQVLTVTSTVGNTTVTIPKNDSVEIELLKMRIDQLQRRNTELETQLFLYGEVVTGVAILRDLTEQDGSMNEEVFTQRSEEIINETFRKLEDTSYVLISSDWRDFIADLTAWKEEYEHLSQLAQDDPTNFAMLPPGDYGEIELDTPGPNPSPEELKEMIIWLKACKEEAKDMLNSVFGPGAWE